MLIRSKYIQDQRKCYCLKSNIKNKSFIVEHCKYKLFLFLTLKNFNDKFTHWIISTIILTYFCFSMCTHQLQRKGRELNENNTRKFYYPYLILLLRPKRAFKCFMIYKLEVTCLRMLWFQFWKVFIL